ncbi:Phosphomannomutase [Tetrabaena socialis]|uniref:Phosphomannomutase n=1 Tax=Tetrabaena socialis TaxID=47790 RepID=A0A2J8AFQ7_9CHLO|nr:Phosphomannomutase [Tetrabaena socialis]|eukprot:PNH11350.1 Phosphomannomutase [Tetrabaena socialis]
MTNTKTIALFDVDGTLSAPRKTATKEMLEFMQELRKKVKVGIVGGSDLHKIAEQLGEGLINSYDYVFAENGLVAYKEGKVLAIQSLKTHLGEDKLKSVANGVASAFFSGTGRHFLALDGGPGERPLLARMAMDDPGRGQYFFSALRAFHSRTAYGNVRGDHWCALWGAAGVSWQNSTLRATDQLPYIPPDVHCSAASHSPSSQLPPTLPGGPGSRIDVSAAAEAGAAPTAGAAPDAAGAAGPGAVVDEVAVGAALEAAAETPGQVVEFALARLQLLPWRRVDVSFAGARLGTAHNNIQAAEALRERLEGRGAAAAEASPS